MDKISLDTQYLLFLLQNLVIFLMDILVKSNLFFFFFFFF